MSHLIELAKQVRGTTVQLLAGVPEDWLLWAPTGTSNHIVSANGPFSRIELRENSVRKRAAAKSHSPAPIAVSKR